MGITHSFVSAVTDQGNAGEVGPNEWNAAHVGLEVRYTPVQEKVSANSNTNSLAVTLDSTPTNGNKMYLLSAHSSTGTISSITQTNVSWSNLLKTSSLNPTVELWVGTVSASAGTGITVAYSDTIWSSYYVFEATGLAGTVDQSSVSGSTTTGYQTGTITPSSEKVVVSVMGTSNGSTAFSNNSISLSQGIIISPVAFLSLSGSGSALGTVMAAIYKTAASTSVLYGSASGNHTSIIASLN